MEKKKLFIGMCCVLLSVLCGCKGAEFSLTSDAALPETKAEKTKAEEYEAAQAEKTNAEKEITEEEITEEAAEKEDDNLTPYQFLYLACGNTDELSFSCTVLDTEAGNTKTRCFQRQKEASVACFTATDMNGNQVSVRELETDGKVHYILDDSHIIKTYAAPAEDFLLYQMTEAAQTAPSRVMADQGYLIYEFELPFIQDETLNYRYCFYMMDGMLKKLTVALGETDETVYEFSEFKQEITDPAAFSYPEEYTEESFDYVYSGESMPPWWEIGNDA